MNPKKYWAIDPGPAICGVSLLSHTGSIEMCFDEKSGDVFRRIMDISSGFSTIEVSIEDIVPYSKMPLRMNQHVIETCKLIGELTYRFRNEKSVVAVNLVPRFRVKQWIFDSFPDVVLPRIEKKMLGLDRRNVAKGKRGLRRSDGELRAPSFVFVDDRIVIAGLKKLHNIANPKPGKPNILGLKSTDHAWQSLAVNSYNFSCKIGEKTP